MFSHRFLIPSSVNNILRYALERAMARYDIQKFDYCVLEHKLSEIEINNTYKDVDKNENVNYLPKRR